MRVLYIRPQAQPLEPPMLDRLREQCVDARVVGPSLLSAFTAMKIARAIDQMDIDIVHASTLPTAMAALSARTVAKKRGVRVVAEMAPNTAAPRGIAAALRQGVDAWIFPTRRLADLYPADLKRPTVAQPYSYDPQLMHLGPAPTHAHNIAWVGPIDKNTDRLIQAIRAVDQAHQPTILTICGRGSARSVMPAVRLSRSIAHPDRVRWHSDPDQLTDSAAAATAVVQAADDPYPIEATVAAYGRPLLPPDSLPAWLDRQAATPEPSADTYDIDKYIYQLILLYNEVF